MKRLFVIAAGLVMTCSAAEAQNNASRKISLRQCIETGIANNQQVLQTDLQTQANEIGWKQSKLNMLPNLNGSVGHGINRGRSIDPFTNSYSEQQISFANYGLSSGVILFNGFTLRNAVKQNKLTWDASKMDWQLAKDNLTIDIILAYLLLLNNEDLLQLSHNQAGLSQKQVERLEALNREGAIAPYLLSDLKGQYAIDQLNVVDAQNAVETSKIALCRLMNIPYDKTMSIERLDAASFLTRYDETPDKIYQTALQQFSLVKAVDLRKLSAEKAVKVARGGLFPTLSLNGNLNTNYSDAARADVFLNTTDFVSTDYVLVNGNPSPVVYKQNNFRSDKIGYGKQLNNNLFSTVSLNLRIPIFNAMAQRNRIKLAGIDLKNSEIVAKTTKTQLQQSIEQAHLNMTAASDRYKLLLQQVDAFSESFRAAEIRFNSGVGNSVDYLTAKTNLDRANVSLVNSKYDFVLRTKILDYYQGKPLW